MIHHTASGPSQDGWPDANYCHHGHQDAPVGNLYLSRVPEIYVMAGGAANTNGSGHDPCGMTPDDSMNSQSIAIEAGNDGVGERWPDAQLDCYEALCRVLCDAYAIPVGRIHAHFEWAPGRKIDPAGPARYATGGNSWDMTAFRTAVGDTGPSPKPPTPSGKDDKLYVILVQDGDPQGRTFLSDLTSKTYIPSPDALAALQFTLGTSGLDNTVHVVAPSQMAGYGPLTFPVDGLDGWGAMT
jgi:hypothetical protein